MKRFYREVSTCSEDGGFSILLDGKPVRTPQGKALSGKNNALAEAVAAEWSAQGEQILAESMPLTQILSTCLDRAGALREGIADKLAAWIDTDLLCYRASPDSPMAELQRAAWDPWLDWFARRFGVRLETTHGLTALFQPARAAESVRAALEEMDDPCFTAAQIAAAASGSIVLALALVEGQGSSRTVFDAVRVEEDYRERLCGEDQHGRARDAQKGRDATLRDLEAVEVFLRLSRT